MPEETTTFTPPASQEELDKILETRLVRERQKYADYDALKEKASKFDEQDAASKTEVQTLQDQIKERDAKLATLPAEARKQAIRFASLANQKGFLDPEDALAFIDVDLDDTEAVKVALDELAERKPHLVRETPKPKPKERPKAKSGDDVDDENAPKGKERAAAALRQFKNT